MTSDKNYIIEFASNDPQKGRELFPVTARSVTKAIGEYAKTHNEKIVRIYGEL